MAPIFRKCAGSLEEFHVKEDTKSSRNTTGLSSLGKLRAAWKNPGRALCALGRVHVPRARLKVALSWYRYC